MPTKTELTSICLQLPLAKDMELSLSNPRTPQKTSSSCKSRSCSCAQGRRLFPPTATQTSGISNKNDSLNVTISTILTGWGTALSITAERTPGSLKFCSRRRNFAALDENSARLPRSRPHSLSFVVLLSSDKQSSVINNVSAQFCEWPEVAARALNDADSLRCRPLGALGPAASWPPSPSAGPRAGAAPGRRAAAGPGGRAPRFFVFLS